MNLGTRLYAASRGFTLLELLIAVSLLLLIATMLFGSFSFARKAWEVRARIDDGASVEGARTFLRREIEAALIRKSRIPERILFVGRRSSLEFTSSVMARTTKGGLYTFTISAETDEASPGASSLRVVQRPFQRESSSGTASHPEYDRLLLGKVADVRFRYFGRQDAGGEARWFDEWPIRSQLPMLVNMQVSFPEHDRRIWPEFNVVLRLAAAQ